MKVLQYGLTSTRVFTNIPVTGRRVLHTVCSLLTLRHRGSHSYANMLCAETQDYQRRLIIQKGFNAMPSVLVQCCVSAVTVYLHMYLDLKLNWVWFIPNGGVLNYVLKLNVELSRLAGVESK